MKFIRQFNVNDVDDPEECFLKKKDEWYYNSFLVWNNDNLGTYFKYKFQIPKEKYFFEKNIFCFTCISKPQK